MIRQKFGVRKDIIRNLAQKDAIAEAILLLAEVAEAILLLAEVEFEMLELSREKHKVEMEMLEVIRGMRKAEEKC